MFCPKVVTIATTTESDGLVCTANSLRAAFPIYTYVWCLAMNA